MAKDPKFRNWSVSEARRNIKRKAVEYKGGKCEVCGYNKSVDAFDFHHRDPSQKDFTISASGNYHRWELVKLELDKCELLCANCHREEHARLRAEHLAEQKRQMREQTPAKTDTGILRNCPQCGVEFRVTPGRLAKSPNPCCSDTCNSKQREQAAWPSDTDLARMVWEQPATTLAATLGVSSSAVKHRCTLRGISTPPHGYWARKRSQET